MARVPIKYLTGAELRTEIWKSKLAYCHHMEPLPEAVVTCTFDYSGEDMPTDATGYVRLFTYEHVPASDRKRTGRTRGIGYEWTNFRPFKVFYNGEEIVRSHWTGGFSNGHFSMDQGKLTNRLGYQIMMLAKRYSGRPQFSGYSYIDEMRDAAVLALTKGILQFDDTVTSNSFAYATQIVHNAFLRVLKDEKKAQQTRDKMLIESGASPSMSYADPFDAAKARYWADKAKDGSSAT